MKLTPERRAERVGRTREAAKALIEDLAHLRGIVEKGEPTRAELRRMSALLRRILSERDLSSVAAPRIGAVYLNAPDNKPLMKAFEKKPPTFFMSGGGASLFGLTLRWAISSAYPNYPDYDGDAIVRLKVDNFLAQPVLCLSGLWARRGDVITYAANVGAGVHSGIAKGEAHKLLATIRNTAYIGKHIAPDGTQGPRLELNFLAQQGTEAPLDYASDQIDPVLFELVCTAYYLTTSPDVVRLEETIRNELA